MNMRQAPHRLHWISLVVLLCGLPVVLSAESGLAVHVSQTVSAPSAAGWRVVESLRIVGLNIHAAVVEQSGESGSGIRVVLPAHSVTEVRSVDTQSSLFKTVEAASTSDGLRLDVSFLSIATRRHCIFDTMKDLLFIVCTQEFPVNEAVARVPVNVIPFEMQRAPELMAAYHSHAADREAKQSDALKTVSVSESETMPQVRHEPLYAFAPLPQEPAIPRQPVGADEAGIAGADATVVGVPLAHARTLRQQTPAVHSDSQVSSSEAPVVHVKRVVEPRSMVEAAEKPALQAIQFNSQEQTLTLNFSRRPHYSLRRTGAESYKLLVSDVDSVHPGLLLPFFAPMDFPGVTVVRAEQLGDAIRFDIQVARSVSLRAVTDPAGISLLVQ